MSVPFPFRSSLNRLIAALLGCFLGQQTAFAQEYRQIEWVDGRVWAAEVVETTAEGMRLRMAQGEAVVAYSEIQAIVPMDEAEFYGAPPWTVELLPLEAGGDDDLRGEAREVLEVLHDHLEEMKGVEVQAGRKVIRGAPPPVVEDCGISSTVSVEERRRDGVDLIVVGHLHPPDGGGRLLTLCSLSTAGTRPLRRLEVAGASELEATQILGGFYRVLGLLPGAELLVAAAPEAGSGSGVQEWAAVTEENPPTASDSQSSLPPGTAPMEAPPSEVPPSEALSSEALPSEALSFVPLPGFPSLVARDLERFGWAWAVVVPGTVLAGLWIAEAGFAPGHVLFLTGAVYYTVTVAANRYFGERTAVDGG